MLYVLSNMKEKKYRNIIRLRVWNCKVCYRCLLVLILFLGFGIFIFFKSVLDRIGLVGLSFVVWIVSGFLVFFGKW